MTIKLFAALLLALLMASCANYTARINPTDKPQAGDTFVYGRFSIDTENVPLSVDGHRSMGLLLQCDNGSSYTMRFYNANPVHVIKIKPGTCNVNEVVFSDADGVIKSKKPLPKTALQNMRFQAGTAYYIGDFFAYINVMHEYGSRFIRTDWKIQEVRSDYRKTTSEMQLNYPGISNLMTEDLTTSVR